MIEILNYIGALYDALEANGLKIIFLILALNGFCAHVAAGWKKPADNTFEKLFNIVNLLAANYGQAKNLNSSEK